MNRVKDMIAAAGYHAWIGFFWGLGFIAAAALVVWVAEAARPMWW